MRKAIIFTLTALLAISSFAYGIKLGIWGASQVASSMKTFMSTAVDGDGNLHNDAGHQAAAEAMFANFERKFDQVLSTDISTMTAEEQMAFFNGVSEILETLSAVDAYARLFEYESINLRVDAVGVSYNTTLIQWQADKVDNVLVIAPDFEDFIPIHDDILSIEK